MIDDGDDDGRPPAAAAAAASHPTRQPPASAHKTRPRTVGAVRSRAIIWFVQEGDAEGARQRTRTAQSEVIDAGRPGSTIVLLAPHHVQHPRRLGVNNSLAICLSKERPLCYTHTFYPRAHLELLITQQLTPGGRRSQRRPAARTPTCGQSRPTCLHDTVPTDLAITRPTS
jgi:hypothetical protein